MCSITIPCWSTCLGNLWPCAGLVRLRIVRCIVRGEAEASGLMPFQWLQMPLRAGNYEEFLTSILLKTVMEMRMWCLRPMYVVTVVAAGLVAMGLADDVLPADVKSHAA